MTTETKSRNEMVRTLAQAVFFTESQTEDADLRKAEWERTREDYVAKARKLLRRLEANGYGIKKNR